MRNTILLIEDAEESKDLVCNALGSSFEIIWAANLKEANHSIQSAKCDLIILDVGLPDGDGFHFFSMLKNEGSHKNTPVIFLTGRDSVSDKVMGISMGADDYILKPFLGAELKARVEMRIKKQIEGRQQGQVISRADLEVNLAEQRAFFKKSDKKIDLQLTPLEFKILVLLLSKEEQVFSRDQLLNQVWGENTYLTDRCIDSHVYTLRKKLGDLSGWIQSVYGQGYRLSSQLSSQETQERVSNKKVA